MLETDGLTIADVDIKVMPFTQMADRDAHKPSTPHRNPAVTC